MLETLLLFNGINAFLTINLVEGNGIVSGSVVASVELDAILESVCGAAIEVG